MFEARSAEITPLRLLGVVETLLIVPGCSGAEYFLMGHLSGALPNAIGPGLILSIGIIALMHSGGLYDPIAILNPKRCAWRAGTVAVPVFALSVWTTGDLIGHSVGPIYPYHLEWTLALTGIWLFSALLLRVLVQQIYRFGLFNCRVVIVGTSAHANRIAELSMDLYGRIELVGHFDADGSVDTSGSLAEWVPAALRLGASELVFAPANGPLPRRWPVPGKSFGLRLTDYLDFYERETGRICIDSLTDDRVARLGGFDATSGDQLRHAMGVFLALVLFIATTPVLLLTALAIKLEDGGPVFYRQERVGRGGKPFPLFKFRSMREDAECGGAPAWAAEGDGRITRVGRFIRMLRIDELPQLWNVLRGDMSFIGPRPERPYFVKQFLVSIPFYACRHVVRPGITGWAQVNFRYTASFADARRKLCYDLYYIKNRSILLDTIILLKTVGVVLCGEGAR